jgi:glycosyltransferase involved in cell wall biosynthesis
MRVAIVHDCLIQNGGAERVLRELLATFNKAPVYTLLFDKHRMPDVFQKEDIHPSFLQSLPFSLKKYQWFLPLMPLATELYDLSEADVVLSSSSAFSKGVITKPDALHVCYCHTPTRYLWSDTHSYVKEVKIPKMLKPLLLPLLSRLRVWDKHAAERVDLFLANSEAVRRRIQKYYHRDATVLYPPVNVDAFSISTRPKTFFLAGGRLVSYKRLDLCLHACNRLKLPLKIFGTGPYKADLERHAGPTVEFVGEVTDEEKTKLFQDCLAFLHPQEEDFGITAVEAMAAGRPVIAYHRGGALETVIEGVTGTFFQHQTWEDLAEALLQFDQKKFDPQHIRSTVERFRPEVFRAQLHTFVEDAWQAHRIRCDF